MNVWINTPFDNLPLEGFRKQRYWLMAEGFVRAGCSVVLWTADFNHGTKRQRRIDPETCEESEVGGLRVLSPCCANGLRVVLLPTRPYRANVGLRRIRSHRAYAAEWMRCADAVALAFGSPRLVLSAMPTIGAAEAAVTLARRFGAMSAVDLMDAWPETFERLAPLGFRSVARFLLRGLKRRARKVYAAADVVTGVCDRYRELVGRDDYFRTYHGIELASGVAVRPKALSGGHVRLVYAGNLGRTYDLETVVRGVGILRRHGVAATLDIAGRGPCEGRVRKLTSTLGLAEAVSFRGYLARAELEALLTASDIGIIPMCADSWVGLPYKIGDYFKAGLAVVSSLGGETEDLIGRHRAGATYRPHDAAGFAGAVQKILDGVTSPVGIQAAAASLSAVPLYDAYAATLLSHVTDKGGNGGVGRAVGPDVGALPEQSGEREFGIAIGQPT